MSEHVEKKDDAYITTVLPAVEQSPVAQPGLDNHGLHRGLKPRHISLLSIGGIIGTGLFLGTGSALIRGGPLGLWLGYCAIGALTWAVMQGLGEMAAYLPIVGGHTTYAGRFFDPSLSFAMTWNVAYFWSLVAPAELSAVAVLMNYWVPDTQISNGVWITIAFVVVFAINLGPSSFYGEAEFIFSSIKVITVVGLIICGIAINCGAGSTGAYIGFKFWKNPGPFGVDYMGYTGAKGQFLGFWAVLTQAAFSYIGAEVVAIAAAEGKNPRYTVPRALRQVIFRIAVFYILGTFMIGLNIASTDKRLGTASDASASPWVLAISDAGIKFLPDLINACIITSAWSAANADIYSASRAYMNLAVQGYAPALFKRTNKYGNPYVSVSFASIWGCLAYMSLSQGPSKVFGWFTNLISIGGIMTWLGICITYLRFRAAMEFQGLERSKLPYTSRYSKVGAWASIVFIIIVTLFSGWTVFADVDHFDIATFVTNYLPAFIFASLYFGRKIWTKSKIIPLGEIDLLTGVREIEESHEEVLPARTWYGRLWQTVF